MTTPLGRVNFTYTYFKDDQMSLIYHDHTLLSFVLMMTISLPCVLFVNSGTVV